MSYKLTAKQERFCREFVIDCNATQAAIRAKYSAKTAENNAYRLMEVEGVKARIKELQDKRDLKTGITAERVLTEINRLAMFDPAELIGINAPQDIKNLPEDVRRAIVGWSWDKSGNFIIKFAKEKALEMLGRYHKLFAEAQASNQTIRIVVEDYRPSENK